MNKNGLLDRAGAKRRSKPEIQRVLEDYQRSDLNQREFAAREGISVSGLQGWLRRWRRRPDPGPNWLEVAVPGIAEAPRRTVTYQLAVPGGVLSVPSGFDPEDLKRLLALLNSQP